MKIVTHPIRLDDGQMDFRVSAPGKLKILYMYFDKEVETRTVVVANDVRPAPKILPVIIYSLTPPYTHMEHHDFAFVPIPYGEPAEIESGWRLEAVAEFVKTLNGRKFFLGLVEKI